MRLFVAIDISAAIRERLSAFVQELRPRAPQLTWVRAENLHLTLKFIGHASEENLPAIRDVLSATKLHSPLELRFRGIGFFPSEKRPRVLWVGVESPPELARLARDIDSALARLGFPAEERAFSPHLTLARSKESRIPQALLSAIQTHTHREFGGILATEFHLIESTLRATGAEYRILASFALAQSSATP